MSSTSDSDGSSKAEVDTSVIQADSIKGLRHRAVQHVKDAVISRDIFLFLVAFRILDALSIRTFFQPDEYFQPLEPAWQIAFGQSSGAWITWEWKYHLRSSVHPFIFALVYWVLAKLSDLIHLPPSTRAELLLAGPKVFQAVVAATGDYYTWKLGQKVHGRRSNEGWATLALTVCNPWQWFCSTRTLSNCLETTLTTIAMYLWPWHWSLKASEKTDEVDADGLRFVSHESYLTQADQLTKLRRCLLLAALACVLRPTNVLIWATLACISLLRATKHERVAMVRETTLCGTLVLLVSALLDRLHYGQWVFPPFRFLYFNVAQSLAVFYGRNDWHYYVSQGYPLLLTTCFPFAILDSYRAMTARFSSAGRSTESLTSTIRFQLASTVVLVPLILSLVSHKEVRFIYPLLPSLHVLSSYSFTAFFLPAVSPVSPTRNSDKSVLKRFLLFFILVVNIFIAVFTSQYHQAAPLSVMSYLRYEYESHYLSQPPATSKIAQADTAMTVGFLMPCHSTPWRSHLVHHGIKAWALGCEPPVHLNAIERAAYLDEADQFYENPAVFLDSHLGRPPSRKGLFGSKAAQQGLGLGRHGDGKAGERFWPDYLVFFEALEKELENFAQGSAYRECWRGWNSWAHDDWRREGDMIVWCLRGPREERKHILIE